MNRVYINVFVQLNLYIFAIIAYADILVTAEVHGFAGCYFRCCIAVCGKVPALVCVICYFADFLQLLFSCSLTLAVSKVIISSSFIAKTAYGCSSAIHNNTACFYTACCYFAACPDSAFAAADAYKSVRIISFKINIVLQSNIIFLATVFIEAFGYSNIIITIGNSTVFECFCFYIFQLAYVYCVGIFNTCCNIDNLTFSASAAYGYRISSVSYTANAQSNAAFCTYASTAADSNCIVSGNRIFMTKGNNIAYASDCVFVTHYNRIGNIVQFIVGTCHKYVMASLFLITDKLVVIADNGRISLFGNSVGTADYCYSTAFFLSQCAIVTLANIVCFPNTYIHILIGISNLVSDTLNRYTIRSLDSVCRAHNIISYAGINLTVSIIYSIFRADNGCRCTLNI